ncbi:TonB-dependent siderophore receptor [Massilia sp. CF038]|uniref:TonB-dependent receptor plug domain-containing protein n=1 Tax=Massilia sp. CF038 TaxID=1881045 RepID=UPI000912066E|nr:TonB-dependent receptor [Massilia sp. CF038]SHH42131.1 iron complex outermembrane recepter protein [Massilia sp. CF038]
MNRLLLLTCLAVPVAAGAAGQAVLPADVAVPQPAVAPVPQITVSGARANETEQRRNATASKMIFGREELDRNGDSNVGEILKRLPGVTMGGPPGRGGGGVRMRGMGNGYTQMLVNGERPPAGFSLESLAPDQVERIEIMRGPVAEHSTQAIAGTINIVLREGYQQKDIQLKVADSVEAGQHSPSLSLTMPGKQGALTWLLNAGLSGNRQQEQGASLYQDSTPDGSLVRDQTISSHTDRSSRGLQLMPRLSYRFANGDTVNFQPFLFANRSEFNTSAVLTQRAGPSTPEYALAVSNGSASATFLRGFGNWLHKLDDGAKLDVKFGFGGGRSRNDTRRNQYDADGALNGVFVDQDSSRNAGASTGGKYTRSMGKGHQLAAGWDLEALHRTQDALALRDGQSRFGQSGDNVSADTRRLAGYIQDEWDITAQWGVYLGLRWEGIRTAATSGARDIRNTSAVWSPVLHTVWRIPGHDKDQLRASLTQSYRAPQVNDLIAAPSFSEPNSPTRPDRSGNPDLKPELAQGIDLAYEHYIGKSGIVSVSGFVRQIDDLMRRALTTYQANGQTRYLSTPSNVGSARTSGIELEAKMQLADLLPNAPSMDVRANYSRFWSSVDGIPGPDNRIDGQAKQTANVGADYRMKKLPLTLGGSYNWTPAVLVQVSPTERASTGVKRQFDAYGLWKFSQNTQLRVGANNLRNEDYLAGRVVATDTGFESASSTARTYTTWSARLEMKL